MSRRVHACRRPEALARARRCCKDVALYGSAAHLPPGLLEELLPGEQARWAHVASLLLSAALAGPVTVVLDRVPGALSAELNPGVERIGASFRACAALACMLSRARAGIRVPDSAFIRSIARTFGGALALTSANVSGGLSTLAVSEFSELWEKARATPASSGALLTRRVQCAYVFDGGRLPEDRRGSTVVDLSKPGTFFIIRDGSARALVEAAARKHALRERSE